MREMQAALAFSQRLDSILAMTRDPLQDLDVTLVSDGDLVTARTLAALDFSRASRVRDTLKRSAASAGSTPATRSLLRMARRPVVKTIGVAALLLGLLQCTWPGGIRGLAISIGNIISGRVSLGTHTTYAVIDSSKVEPVALDSGDRYGHWSRIGRQGLPTDIDPSIARFSSFSEAARTVIGFKPRLPRHVPRGWEVGLVLVFPTRDMIITFYKKYHYIIQFHQSLGGQNWGTGISDGSETRMVTFDGIMAAWQTVQVAPNDVDTTLVWEHDGISYGIVAETLDLDEVVRIAASIR